MPYLPSPFKRFCEHYPELNDQYEKLARACHEAGPLDEKSRRLVKLGIAIGQQSEGAIKSHARRAIEEGTSVEEVRHAALLALTTMGFPGMIAAIEWIEEVIEAKGK
jgi:alkylhydroperoxidase/carboxymuconolactone decarboxylase family protein YurZ